MQKKELDYLNVLKVIGQMPFNVGKKLLLDFLQGNSNNESIKRNLLDRKELFGYFSLYSRDEVEDLVENLLHNGLIDYVPLTENKFIKIITLTKKGKKELVDPSLHNKKLSSRFAIKETQITEQERMMFDSFDFFLKGYNDEQKKAITSSSSKMLCVAGAGSGKTTVLTKRIEFLTTFKSAAPEKILAITFTRKARAEMASRLSKSQYCTNVMTETFNSFCEKIIKKHNDLIYNKPTRVVSYGEKIKIFKIALKENNIDAGLAIESYFSFGQRREKTNEELATLLMNDCYSVIELYKINNKSLEELKEHANNNQLIEQKNIEMMYKLCYSIDSFMKRNGLRDYSDQIVHCIDFFKKNKNFIPQFDHMLVDEYQDVNSSQIELLDLINPANLFCVGDPRQSIFGWRGSKIKYVLNFEEKYPDCEIITLSTNYRSSKQIVNLINKSIEGLMLPDLKSFREENANLHLVNFESEEQETNFVISKILELRIPRNEIFVLARTNRIINDISQRMRLRGIKHLVKTEEKGREEEAAIDEVTLATVHSIKGLEADTVFVIGCTGINFPCRASDHPIIELVRIDDYDKEEEERRLFYVALSRAKKNLYMTYCGKNPTRFINQKMLETIGGKTSQPSIADYNAAAKLQSHSSDKLSMLKVWRKETAQRLNLPAYIIMHDRTLMEIIEMNPVDVEDLKNVRGIGPAKLERYGEEIINILNGGK